MTKRCPTCHTENRDSARHCMACGAAFTSAATPVHLCPAGRHPMDPGWRECPYCKTEGTVGASERKATILETPPRGTVPETPARGNREPDPASSLPPQPPPLDGSRPAAEEAAPDPEPEPDSDSGRGPGRDPGSERKPQEEQNDTPRRKTRFDAVERRIVALLVTYSRRPGGEVFPLREGRNYVGSGEECEVRMTGDRQLSSRHATIIYRGKDFWIDDEKSMNGTYVDGDSVEERRRLANHAEIRTGSTVWRFVVVDPPGGGAAGDGEAKGAAAR